jgi:hypothetical protein
MTTREAIKAEIDNLDEEVLDELLTMVKSLAKSKPQTNKQTFMSKLLEIQIDAPEDFSENLDAYLSGEKNIE